MCTIFLKVFIESVTVLVLFCFVCFSPEACGISAPCCCCSVAKLCPTLCDPMDCSNQVLCSSLSSRVGSNSCSLSWWCYLTISSSIALFSFCLQSFIASGSFLRSQLFLSGGQCIGASAIILPMNIQGGFPLGLTGLITYSPRDSKESSPAPQLESTSSLALSLLYDPDFSMIQWMLTIWSLTLLPFLNPECTSGSSRLTYSLKPRCTPAFTRLLEKP